MHYEYEKALKELHLCQRDVQTVAHISLTKQKQMKETNTISPTDLVFLHELLDFPVPDDFYSYMSDNIFVSIAASNLFINKAAEAFGIKKSLFTYWHSLFKEKRQVVSLYDYKEQIDAFFKANKAHLYKGVKLCSNVPKSPSEAELRANIYLLSKQYKEIEKENDFENNEISRALKNYSSNDSKNLLNLFNDKWYKLIE